MHAETHTFRGMVKVEGVPLLRKRQMARQNILCNRCGPGGWPGPHSFLIQAAGATPSLILFGITIALLQKSMYDWFRVLFAHHNSPNPSPSEERSQRTCFRAA
jgi:hypothetical protein